LNSIFNVIFFFSSCHLPILYVGLEYSLTNNLRLAERLYSESLKFYPDDPAVLHELGVINYLNREYHHALLFFQRALIKVEAIDQVDLLPYWEPLFNNMGHACRKLKLGESVF
jgi:anaphase-promoting complex subunit 6